MNLTQNKMLVGAALAVLATLIWSGNFIIARSVPQQIHPVSLAFFRWITATAILFPIGFSAMRKDWPTIKQHLPMLCFSALAGITFFNTFIYIAGHYSPAINLALVGNTSAPILAILLARIFLKELITPRRMVGLAICIIGIFTLLSKGNFQNLLSLRFTKGDIYMLMAGLSFAVYTILVKKKPSGISPTAFLLSIFILGTLFLVPFFIYERSYAPPIQWRNQDFAIILYLGLGTSVISFLSWNAAIARMGAARTALFGNLTPLFSAIEAVIFLGEKITRFHVISFVLVIAGLVIANSKPVKSN